MTKILVNALSLTNQSGLHVLAGHLDGIADHLRGEFRLVVLHRASSSELISRLGSRVDWVLAPECTSHWLARAVWELRHLRQLASKLNADVYFTPNGMCVSTLAIPQIAFCQNPWAMVSAARRRRDALKAWLQRAAYRRAMRTAALMVFNSHFMQHSYRQNAGFKERQGAVVYQAADDDTHRRAEQWKERPRVPGQIACVSAMAPHKNIEAVILAFKKLTSDLGPPTSDLRPPPPALSLRLVGSWPDRTYERKIRLLVSEQRLEDRVRFDGFVSREELDRIYAESQIFCLMSRCESFGIPAIEAQLFGTPVVCSNVCAIPEICGDGGLFCDPDDIIGIGDALAVLLADDTVWQKYSVQARRNAARFKWLECSRHLADAFRSVRLENA